MKNLSLIPKITLWVLLAIGVVVSVLFYVGGASAESIEVAGEYLSTPRFTDLFLNWNYILLGIVILVTLCVVCVSFVEKFKVDKKAAIKSLAIIVAFVLLAVVCWILGSPEKVNIVGYEGTDNVGFMAQLSDMMMYMTYVLLALTIIAIICGAIYSRKK